MCFLYSERIASLHKGLKGLPLNQPLASDPEHKGAVLVVTDLADPIDADIAVGRSLFQGQVCLFPYRDFNLNRQVPPFKNIVVSRNYPYMRTSVPIPVRWYACTDVLRSFIKMVAGAAVYP